MRTEAVLLALLAGGGSSACLGNRSPAVAPEGAVADGGGLRPLTQAVTIQAAFNDTTFFLHVRWSSASVVPALSLALSGREPATAVRDFPTAGCFLACHDASTDMPNWRPEDGARPMYLLPGFGGPAEVWRWQALPGAPTGQAAQAALGTEGLVGEIDGGTGGLMATGALAAGTWDVLYVRPLAAAIRGEVTLTAGAAYDLGLALHPDGVVGRHHYVSLPVALGLANPSAALAAVPLAAGATPDFADTATFPALPVTLFLPGITSFEFLVGAAVDRNGALRNNDFRHGGGLEVATGARTCSDCHRVASDSVVPPVQNAGALERLVLRRGGVVGPPAVEVLP